MKKNLLSKALVIALSTAMLSATLVGCGKKPAADSNASSSSNPKDLKGTITFWHFNKDEGPNLAKAFMEKYPNVKVVCQITPDTDKSYQNKVTSALRAGSGLPDVIALESAYVKRFVNLNGLCEDLTKAPYNATGLTSKMVPYTISIGKDNKGTLRALSWQATPGGIAYKKALAKQYLGTDDPDQISQMLATKDKILETAKKLKDASGGKVKLLPDPGELSKIYQGGRSTGWIDNNKLVIDPKMDEYIDLSKSLRDAGGDAGYTQWQPNWSSSIGADDALCYAMPPWGLANIIGCNDKNAKGRWGLAKAPFPYFWGGTWLSVTQASKNKKLAWEFVKFLTTNEDHLNEWTKKTGDFMNNTDVIANQAKNGEDSDIIGTSMYKVFKDQVNSINGKILTPQDDLVESDFNDSLTSYLSGKIKSKDDMIKAFKDKVKSDLPDLTVN